MGKNKAQKVLETALGALTGLNEGKLSTIRPLTPTEERVLKLTTPY